MSVRPHFCCWSVLLLFVAVGTSASDPSEAARVQQIVLDRQILQKQLLFNQDVTRFETSHHRGIVFPCGGARQLANAYVGLRVIRNYHLCDLPVEIAYYGSHEMDDYHRFLFQAMKNTTLVDLSSTKRLEYKGNISVGGYAAKAFAIIHSSFEEILCLDSDNIPLRDPSSLFDIVSYQQHGNVFWSDPNINGLDASVYEMFSLQPPWAEDPTFLASESGQILLNRQKHRDVLQWLWFVTANSDFFYPKMHGDKDTYRLAFALAGRLDQYNQVKAGPRLGLAPLKRPEGLFYLSAGFVQPDFNNSPVFYHRVEVGAKLNPASPFVLNPLYVTTTLSHSWRRPPGTVWFNQEYGNGGTATHYPASHVNTSAYRQCCPSLASHGTFSSCSCQPTSSDNDHMMLALPLAFYPELRSAIVISHKIFSAYQHELWRHEQTLQSS